MVETANILRDLKDVVNSLKAILTTDFKPNDPDTQKKLMTIYTYSLKKYQPLVEKDTPLESVLNIIIELFEESISDDETYFFIKPATKTQLINQCESLVRESKRKPAEAAAA